MCTFLVKAESGGGGYIPNVDMWEGTRSAWHSKSLEQRCQTLVYTYVSGLLLALYKVCIRPCKLDSEFTVRQL